MSKHPFPSNSPWKDREAEYKVFEDSVCGLMKCWSTLRLTVEHQFGGQDSEQKKDSMIQSMLARYKNKGNTINPNTLCDTLISFFENKMSTSVEDDIEAEIQDISNLIGRLCAECIVGELTLAKQIIEDAKKPLESAGFAQYVDGDNDDDEEDEDEDDCYDDQNEDEEGEDDNEDGEEEDEEEDEDNNDDDNEEEEVGDEETNNNYKDEENKTTNE
ncbi:pre-rRNA-processing protein TSR2, putative [Entamoeba invadens IP1]|uniref:Pre-rRNA-processing protein TSR2, putative n=1 Tax=Entamoeba invadens IP1 TaxID=370355 RepID=A0A0A1UH94_ENTIV|nr:pre-rRNA-processing protein TSR2, putative [Entamoeba invadens IP1]ELP94927.1 pre-rRNA-processing protein TSR2, putative [Entamoeba invadens IP1]|eukprot:XP_004261698.1 pre-rRNA-processing protein TSR2, putative [Entamoeba invadens IP1]